MSEEDHGTGAFMPSSIMDIWQRFVEKYEDGDNVHIVLIGAGCRGHSLSVFSERPDELELPEEFEGMEVFIQPPLAKSDVPEHLREIRASMGSSKP